MPIGDQPNERAVCVASAGLHDMAVPGATASVYTTNVVCFLSKLLQQECEHVVWLTSTGVLRSHKYRSPALSGPWNWVLAQSRSRIHSWNALVVRKIGVIFGHSVNMWSLSRRVPGQNGQPALSCRYIYYSFASWQ